MTQSDTTKKEIKVIDDGIIFKFIEDASNKGFDNQTSWGFVVKDKINDVKHPRWAEALVVGPAVKHVAVGDYILVENLQWTNMLEYKDDKFWKTNETRIIMVSQVKPTNFTAN